MLAGTDRTYVADTEQLLRLIQSIPSPKAEPLKRRLNRVGSDLKGLKKENLWDNMSTKEPVPNILAKASTAERSKLEQTEEEE